MGLMQTDVGRHSTVIVVGVIVACAAIGYIAITYLANDSSKQSQIEGLKSNTRGTPVKETERYAQVLDHYNKQRAMTAEKTGESYVSALSSRGDGGVQDTPPSQQKLPPQQPATNYQQVTPPVQQQNVPPDPQRDKEEFDRVKTLLENWQAQMPANARVGTDTEEYVKSISRQDGTASTNQTQQTEAAALAKIKIVTDFALVPALLETEIDTDENSLVTALIPSGEYAGAKLYAVGYKRLTNTVDMTFTFMMWQGHSYKVNAKALDQNTMRTALSGDVNNRYFSRIVLPAIATGIGKAGQLYQQASEQNIITPQGSVVQTYPTTPSASAVTGTIFGGIASQTGQVMVSDASKIPEKQVLIAKGTTIGIQFIGPVLASDDLALGSNGNSQQAQQGQGQGVDLNVLGAPALPPARQNLPKTTQASNVNNAGDTSNATQGSFPLQQQVGNGTPSQH